MKQLKSYFCVLLMLCAGVSLAACSDDDDDTATADYGSKVAGVYTGTLSSNGYVIDDAYVVRVTRVSNTVVQVSARFFGDDEKYNFNVDYVNGQYVFRSSNMSNINFAVNGKILSISYTNVSGSLVNFTGSRD